MTTSIGQSEARGGLRARVDLLSMKGTTIAYWPRDPYGELAEPTRHGHAREEKYIKLFTLINRYPTHRGKSRAHDDLHRSKWSAREPPGACQSTQHERDDNRVLATRSVRRIGWAHPAYLGVKIWRLPKQRRQT